MKKFGVLFFVLFLVGSVSSATWYVDQNNPSCDDLGSGSSETPFCTIATANNRHAGGDTVYILPGEYRERLFPKSGVAGNPTIYSGYGDRTQTKILGSEIVTGWEQYSEDIYRAPFEANTQCRTFDFNTFYTINNTNCFEDRSNWFERPLYPTLTVMGGGTVADIIQPGQFVYEEGYIYLRTFESDNPTNHLIECTKIPVFSLGEYTGYPTITYFILQNLTIMETDGRGLNFDGFAHDVDILNNEISFTTGSRYCAGNPAAIYHGSNGAYTPTAVHFNIINNKIHDLGSDMGSAVICEGNHCGDGICDYSVMDSIIENNTFYNMAMGVDLKVGNQNVTIRNNLISNTTYQSIRLACLDDENMIDGNIIYNLFAGQAITLGKESDNNIVRHNVVYNTPTNSLLIYVGDCGLGSIPSTGTIAQNNIFFSENYEISMNNGVSANSINYNLFDNSQSTPSFYYFTSTLNLTSWKTISGFDQYSLEEDPTFVNSSAGEFHLQAGSPAIDAGEFIEGYHCPVNYETDPNQEGCRVWSGVAPDIGAIEYMEEVSEDQCFEGEITSSCQCGEENYSVGFCCDVGSEMIWFDPDYPQCPQNYYYIDNSGNCSDLNSGTETQPWCSIRHAADVLIAGDVVLIKEGIYNESYSVLSGASPTWSVDWDTPNLAPLHSGTYTNPIIFKGYPGEVVEIYSDFGSVVGTAIELNTDYIVWDNVKLLTLSSFWDTTGSSVRNSEFDSSGIVCSGGSNCMILWISDVYNFLLKNNYFHNHVGAGENDKPVIIYGTNDSIFENNYFKNNLGISGALYTKGSFPDGTANYNNIYRYNLIENVYGPAIFFGKLDDPNSGNRVYQNIVINPPGVGNFFQIKNDEHNKDEDAYNNLMYNGDAGIHLGSLEGYPYERENLHYYNNVLINVRRPVSWTTESTPGIHFFVNYNNYINCSNYFDGNGSYWNIPYTYDEWRNLFSQDLSSYWNAPDYGLDQFVDATNGDFHLIEGSPLWTAGTDWNDYNNNGITDEAIPIGPYITGDEIIGVIDYSSGYVPPPEEEDCSLTYDTSPCNCLTNIELGNGVNAWFRGELGIGDLMQHLNLWRTNSSC